MHLNQKPTLRQIGCAHRASVQPDGLVGNCQAQSNSSGGSFAGIVDAVEGLKYLLQLILGNPGTGIADLDISCVKIS